MFGTSQLHDYFEPSDTAESRALMTSICASARAENQTAARRLASIAELFELRRQERGEREDWAVDTWAAVGAEVAAALRISPAKAGSYMNYGLAMKQLPAVAALFIAGAIDVQMFQTVVYRTALITDDCVLAEVDRLLAQRAERWPSMTRGRLASEIDRIVSKHDPDAVRRVREKVRDREVVFGDEDNGCVEVIARLASTDAHAFERRLDALAKSVCDADPRTNDQRHADAVGALAVSADRLACQCREPGCSAAENPAPGAVVIHIVAEQGTVHGESDNPGYQLGANAVIPAEVVAEIARNAKLSPLVHPIDVPSEPAYRPSRALADFVRARDLTCRAPGCDKPATQCDLDHTVPYPYGPTHAGNLKCLCRRCHILKTFWGWRDKQLADGTVIWELPGNQIYVTTPGSALLFPSLMTPTLPPLHRLAEIEIPADRTLFMPRRKSTRAQNRAKYIAAERRHNRTHRVIHHGVLLGPAPPPSDDDDPPPF
ncbi:HNH endonuclease signature motif containing protein [Mycolicibacterium sp. P1-5]|uniref:HNH endonuclease signature motif containing protein n=1 Tax=Mycolicibacterium sp. P1-5 TaxID=2024617 RepID=UPI0011EBE1FF|nr:HNH endonuclease signature motif containing protein [Mycolicibacterium sp. P1-5]KAA0110145.1 HNH endonuclease [Mycolicibacterium sp. P1-5]